MTYPTPEEPLYDENEVIEEPPEDEVHTGEDADEVAESSVAELFGVDTPADPEPPQVARLRKKRTWGDEENPDEDDVDAEAVVEEDHDGGTVADEVAESSVAELFGVDTPTDPEPPQVARLRKKRTWGDEEDPDEDDVDAEVVVEEDEARLLKKRTWGDEEDD